MHICISYHFGVAAIVKWPNSIRVRHFGCDFIWTPRIMQSFWTSPPRRALRRRRVSPYNPICGRIRATNVRAPRPSARPFAAAAASLPPTLCQRYSERLWGRARRRRDSKIPFAAGRCPRVHSNLIKTLDRRRRKFARPLKINFFFIRFNVFFFLWNVNINIFNIRVENTFHHRRK